LSTRLPLDEIEIDDDTKRVIAETLEAELPPRVGTRDNRTWPLGRALKAVPALYLAEVGDLKPYVRCWHALGVELGVIGTLSFDAAWAAFMRVWPKIKFPKGADPMKMIVERAENSPLPPAATNYDSAPVRRLVAICKALQDAAGDKPFFIACRVAGELIGVHYTTAADYLYMLCNDKPPVLRLVMKGKCGKRRASRYRYVAD
jgi:hypothetical protein